MSDGKSQLLSDYWWDHDREHWDMKQHTAEEWVHWKDAGGKLTDTKVRTDTMPGKRIASKTFPYIFQYGPSGKWQWRFQHDNQTHAKSGYKTAEDAARGYNDYLRKTGLDEYRDYIEGVD